MMLETLGLMWGRAPRRIYTFEAHFIRPGHPYVVMPATGVLTAYADVPAWPTGTSEGSGWIPVTGTVEIFRERNLL